MKIIKINKKSNTAKATEVADGERRKPKKNGTCKTIGVTCDESGKNNKKENGPCKVIG